MQVYCHPTCTTCKRALKWLEENHFIYQLIDIREQPPTKEMFLKELAKGIAVTKMANTSGELYRSLNLKDKIKEMTHEEIAELLASNGMLVKRPVMVSGDKISFGAQEKMLSEVWL